MGWFKSKEEKIKNKQAEVDKLNQENAHMLNALHLNGKIPFIAREFKLVDGEICLACTFPDTPQDMIVHLPYWACNLKETRMAWLRLKNNLQLLGITVKW